MTSCGRFYGRPTPSMDTPPSGRVTSSLSSSRSFGLDFSGLTPTINGRPGRDNIRQVELIKKLDVVLLKFSEEKENSDKLKEVVETLNDEVKKLQSGIRLCDKMSGKRIPPALSVR